VRVGSHHSELQPDITVRVGEQVAPCSECQHRAIYDYQGRILCRACASLLQTALNRLRGRIVDPNASADRPDPATPVRAIQPSDT